MKTYINSILILIFLCSAITNFSYAQETKTIDAYSIKVDGLGCPFCAYGLEKKFKEFKAITNIKMDMETGVFTFTYPASNPLSIAKVSKQVEKAGYTPISVRIVRADGKEEKQVSIVTSK